MKMNAERKSALVIAVFLVTLCLSAAVLGQELAATLTGTVLDPSGAVVVGATVVVHSEATGSDLRTVTTTGSGGFNITNIPAGRYTVTVTNGGFQTSIAKDVILNVAEKHTLDIHLQAGKASEEMIVTAENTAIQTTTAEQSGTVTGDQVRELALNNRNFEQLVLLQPGVAGQLGDEVGFGLSNNTTISVNGARASSNNWTVDGADINDSGSNGTLLNTPSIDAIQEFTLARSNYDAAYGRSGGGQVVVATKSGTNQFHGGVYEFNRNNYFNANTFENRQAIGQGADPAANKTPIERYNDWGFTIGGPFFIPKLFHPQRDKTFFFWSEEWRHASTPGTNTITVPTAAELAGTFVGPIVQAPPGCVTTSGSGAGLTSTISPSCFSQNASAYLNGFMSAFPAGANGQVSTGYTQLNNYRQDIIRLDQNVGDRVQVFARYMQDSVPQNFPYGLWGAVNYPGVETTSLNAPGRNLVINATATISPKVVNEVEFADSYGAINSVLTGAIASSPKFLATLTNKTAYQDPNGRAPNITFAGGTAGLANTSAPYFERNKDYNLFDNVSIQHGNHNVRLGATVSWLSKTENASNGAATFNFSNTNKNPEYANFLLGQADSYTQQSKDTTPFLHYTNFEAYIQDDWKLTPRLTLNLGVRYSYFPSPSDSNNTLTNFVPSRFEAANAPTIDPATGLFESGNSAKYANGLVFPTGAACTAAQAVGDFVSCSPYGNKVNPSSNNNWGPRLGIAWDPFGNGKWSVRGGYGIFFDRSLNGIWEQNAFSDPPLVQTSTVNNTAAISDKNIFDDPISNGTAAGAPLGPSALTITGSPAFKVPSYQDFNVSVQHEVLRNTVVEVAYVGTKGVHLLGDQNLNQVPLATRLANPNVDANALVPFPGYQAIVSRNPVFTSNYNSLQVAGTRRMSNGLTLQASYTWSRLLTTNPVDRAQGAYDSYNLAADYGPSTLNTPQIFVLSYVYDLPFYKEQRGLAGRVLGGWEISGIVNFQTGQSLTVTQSSDPFDSVLYPGGVGLTRGSTAQLRTDLVGDPHGPKTPSRFFNIAAFAPAVGHFGNERPGSFLGPGFQRWDTSLIKNVRIAERVGLQLRLETFNTFNHGSPASVGTSFGSCDVTTGINCGSFGAVTSWHIPRELQLGAKINF